MIVYTENPEVNKIILKLINYYSKFGRYKVSCFPIYQQKQLEF